MMMYDLLEMYNDIYFNLSIGIQKPNFLLGLPLRVARRCVAAAAIEH